MVFLTAIVTLTWTVREEQATNKQKREILVG